MTTPQGPAPPPQYPQTRGQWALAILAPHVAAIIVAGLGFLGFVVQSSDEPDCLAELKAAVAVVDQHPELIGRVPVDPDVERECKIKGSLRHVQPKELPPPKP
ncbi:hypothetical protein ACWD0A_07870 [Streptomyces sp. NPDC002867]